VYSRPLPIALRAVCPLSALLTLCIDVVLGEMGLNFSLLPILGKLLVGHQPALDRALLPGDAAASARGGRRRRPRS